MTGESAQVDFDAIVTDPPQMRYSITRGHSMDQDSQLPRVYSRRLSDKMLVAFDHACDEGKLDAAAELLEIAKTILLREPAAQSDRRKAVDLITKRQERLSQLRRNAG
jgi:hypothetical protein